MRSVVEEMKGRVVGASVVDLSVQFSETLSFLGRTKGSLQLLRKWELSKRTWFGGRGERRRNGFTTL